VLHRREFYVASSKDLGDLSIAPVVEFWASVTLQSSTLRCVVQARPLGFAVLTEQRGYWLVGPASFEELARAVDSI
jgi:hypothetical protein